MKNLLSENLQKLSKEFLSENSRLYIVGGYNRNYILGFPLDDIDICGTLHYDEVNAICGKLGYECKEVNKKLGTLLIIADGEKYEYTPFRTENYILGKHAPESVVWTDDIRIDAKRRDFTCNAIYYDIEEDNFIDFYNGAEDIQAKRLKTVETPEFVFSSDGLRILRLVRFACGLNFKIDTKTYNIAKKMLYQLKYISGERKTAELKGIFETSSKYNVPDKALILLNKFRLYPYIAPMPNIPKKINIKKYGRAFSKSEDKFLTFVFILLLCKYGKEKVGLDQIIFDIQTVVNEILHAGGDIKEMSKTLYVIMQIQKDKDSLPMCIMYNNLKYASRQIVKCFCDTSKVVDKIKKLKEENIPLTYDDLEISNAEIMEILPKETISHVKNLFMDKCQKGLLPNQHDILLKELRRLGDSKEIEKVVKNKRNKTT